MSSPAGWSWLDQDTPLAVLKRAVMDAGERTFLDIGGDLYTYADIDRLTNRLGHSLADLGVRAGDTVVTMFDNNVDAVVGWLGINKIRAVSVPLNTALRGEFLRHQIADAAAAIIICEADYVERIAAIADQLPDLKLILYRGPLGRTPERRVTIQPFDNHRGIDETPIALEPQPGDLACLIYTSGTTGPSKGCMIGHNYMVHLAKQQLRAVPADEHDISITPLPFFHMNAICTSTVSTMLVKGRVCLTPRFSVSNFWPEVERSGATVASILGSMGTLLANAPDNEAMKRCFGQLHTIRGNPFPPEIKEIWRNRFGAKRVGSNGYGITEAAVVTSLPAGEHAPPGSSGKRLPEFEVIIADDDDRELPPNTPGEVLVRPLRPNIMFQGYWRRPDATLSIMRNMWLHCGDIGKFDDEGFFYFIDRKKDYLRRRGENISSFEMELTFALHPAIEDVAVHAVFSPIGEDDLKVTAVLREGARLDEAELCRWCLDKVPHYAVPRFIEFRDSLPKNTSGRVLKYQLRDEGATAATWDLEKSDIVVVKR